MGDMEMFQDWKSESDSENSEQDNGLQRSADSFVEYMDIDVEPSGNQLNEFSQQKLSDESGIDLELSFRRPVLTTCNTENIKVSSNNNNEESIDQLCTPRTSSTPKTSKTRSKTTKLPSLNIFKIDLEKVDEAMDKAKVEAVTKNNKGRINFMVEAMRDRQSGQDQNSYVLKPYPGHYVSTKFKVIYCEKRTIATDDEARHTKVNIHKIRFLHRSDSDVEEIFALPSGSGRYAVLQWADTNFPSSIASKSLHPESITDKEVKCLLENRYLTRLKMKKGEPLQSSSEFHCRFAPKVYTKYHANINSVELKRVLGIDNDSTVKMQVSLESVLFPNVEVDLNQYAKICKKLSEIYNDPNLPRSRAFDGYLSKVSKNRRKELDNLLLKELEQFFRLTTNSRCDNVSGKLKNFMITTKDSTKNIEDTKFNISYRRKLVKKLDQRPQLYELHTLVNKNFSKNSLHSFTNCFKALIISTKLPSGDDIREKIWNCLEGVFYDETTRRNYWRVGNNWYQVTGKYSFDVYAEYIRVLKKSLLEKQHCSLTHLWPLRDDRIEPLNDQTNRKGYEFTLKKYREERFVREGEYNALYKKEKYFTVIDCYVAPKGVEIGDLYQCIPNSNGKYTIYLYHVKKVFNADGYRVAVRQILDSVYYLRDSFIRKGSDDSAAQKLFDHVKRHQKDTIVTDYDEFLEQLKNAVIVFSPLFESGNRDLDIEYMFRLKYDFSDFEDCIELEFREDLKTELESFLLKSEYIYPDKDFTQKWYDACAVTRDKGFTVRHERGFQFDPFPSRRNLSSIKLRQILKQKYYKTVEGLATKQQVIQMAEELSLMGFGFKICQIEGAGDEFLPDG